MTATTTALAPTTGTSVLDRPLCGHPVPDAELATTDCGDIICADSACLLAHAETCNTCSAALAQNWGC